MAKILTCILKIYFQYTDAVTSKVLLVDPAATFQEKEESDPAGKKIWSSYVANYFVKEKLTEYNCCCIQ